jgi:RNA polymerase sigma factor (sigma-70 family)
MQEDSNSLVACIPRLRRYARALVGDKAAADELVQDTMERGWHRLSTWERGSDLRPWLFGILHSLYAERMRHSPPPAAQAPAEQRDMRDMQAALLQLAPEQREVLLLVALEEMRYEEVAEVLQIPAGTVLSRLSRARERLRLIMLGQAPASPLKVVK